MKCLLFNLVAILCFFYSVKAQTRTLRWGLDSLSNFKDELMDIDEVENSEEQISVFNFDEEYLEQLVLIRIRKQFRGKYKRGLKRSDVLNKMSKLCSNILSKSKFEEKSWKKTQKYIFRGLRSQQCGFGIYSSYAFRVNITESPNRKYYDKNDADTELHIFKGKRPKKEYSEDGELIENKNLENAIKHKTYSVLADEILKELTKRKLKRIASSGYFHGVGIDVLLDKRTIGGSKLPKVRVVVFVGGKRLARFKKPKK